MSKKLLLIPMLLLFCLVLQGCTPEGHLRNKEEPRHDPVKEYEPTVIDESEEETSTKVLYLSVFMSKKDVMGLIDDEYSLITETEYGGIEYYTILKYEEISFFYSHGEEELKDDAIADLIEISSNKYSYNYDINIGGKALEALEFCEQYFSNTFDIHSREYIFNIFDYKEKKQDGSQVDTDYVLRLEIDSDYYINKKEEVSSDTKLAAISLFIPLS